MYLLPYEAQLNSGVTDVVAVGNMRPVMENLEVHRLQVSTNQPVKIEVLAAKQVSGQDITGLVASSNGTKQILGGIFRVIENPRITKPFILKTMLLKPTDGIVDIVDQMDGVTLTQGVYLILRAICTENTTLTANFLWMQPESRQLL